MGEIINLRQARKAKARGEAERKAASNRNAFGRTKAERDMANAERVRRERLLDGATLNRASRDDPAD